MSRLRQDRERRRAQQLVGSLLGAPAAIALALVLFGIVNYLSARHYRRLDWTRHSLFTLSPRSREIVRSLREPMDLYIFLGAREPQYSDVTELAQRYAGESARLRVHTIDPDRQRDRFLEITRRLGIRVGRTSQSDVASEAAVVLVRGERHHEVPREALAGLHTEANDEGGTGPRQAQAQITVERAITEAISSVEHNEATTLCFATGHGELALEGGDDSVSMLAAELRHDNVTTRAVDVRGVRNVPDECDALVVAGPRQSYTDSDADMVTRYVRGGGNVLLLVDPMFVNRQHVPTGLESVARLGGVDLTRSIVVEADDAHRIPESLPTQFLATEFGDHPVTRALRGADARIVVANARALRRAEGSLVVPESLLRTTATAWGETGTTDAIEEGELRANENDVRGPVHVAMAAQVPDVRPASPRARARGANGRMVVVGYSHLATNESFALPVQARFVSGFFVVGAIGWLTSRRELIEIPARPASAAAMNISVSDIRHVRLYAVLLVPLAAALVGIAVWRARKAR